MRKKSTSASPTSKKLAKKQSYSELIRKSIAAALMIGLGDYILLKVGNLIGPFLFAFGLLSVCVMGANLFTGKCGFLIEDKIKPLHLALILLGNLVAGYLLGLMFSAADAGIISVAQEKVASWHFDWSFFIRSILCGVIMYLAVAIYRKGSKLGILFGVPLFILCGFQHCIANIITLGVAQTFSWTILLCVLGNFIGSIITWWLCGQKS